MQIYVNRKYTRSGNGSKEYPFRNISEAAAVACPGDEVLVAPGVYREYVDPKQAGTEEKRIVYRSIEPGKAVITGAEVVKNWKKYEGNVYLSLNDLAQALRGTEKQFCVEYRAGGADGELWELTTGKPAPEKLVDTTFSAADFKAETLELKGVSWWKNYRVLGAGLVILSLILLFIFR